MNVLVVLLGLPLLVFLPGFTLLKALFPERRLHPEWHVPALAFLSVTASLAILVLVGLALAFLPPGPDGRGWFQGSATGKPILEATLGAISAALFGAGLLRGAYPRIRRAAGAKGADLRVVVPLPLESGHLADAREARARAHALRREARAQRRRGNASAAESLLGDAAEADDDARRAEAAAREENYGEPPAGARPRIGRGAG